MTTHKRHEQVKGWAGACKERVATMQALQWPLLPSVSSAPLPRATATLSQSSWSKSSSGQSTCASWHSLCLALQSRYPALGRTCPRMCMRCAGPASPRVCSDKHRDSWLVLLLLCELAIVCRCAPACPRQSHAVHPCAVVQRNSCTSTQKTVSVPWVALPFSSVRSFVGPKAWQQLAIQRLPGSARPPAPADTERLHLRAKDRHTTPHLCHHKPRYQTHAKKCAPADAERLHLRLTHTHVFVASSSNQDSLSGC